MAKKMIILTVSAMLKHIAKQKHKVHKPFDCPRVSSPGTILQQLLCSSAVWPSIPPSVFSSKYATPATTVASASMTTLSSKCWLGTFLCSCHFVRFLYCLINTQYIIPIFSGCISIKSHTPWSLLCC